MARTTRKAPRDVAQDITDAILASLEAGTVPWHQPWASTGGQLPRSMATGKLYQGMNSFLLGMYAQTADYTSPWWGTYNQIKAQGGQVTKGEKASTVILYRTFDKDQENPKTGETETVTIPVLRAFSVFNACQTTGLPEKYTTAPTTGNDFDPIESAEAIVKDYTSRGGPSILHGFDAACYNFREDRVYLPNLNQFETPEDYYATNFHELGHSTGAEKRLAREGIAGSDHKFGDAVYSFEELIAEMTAAMVCTIVGIDQTNTLPQHAGYIAHWIQVLKGDKKMILKAAAGAQKATNLIAPITEVGEDADDTESEAA